MRQAGQDAEQQLFRHILLHLRNAECTLEDWKHLMRRTLAFDGVLHLCSTAAEATEHNISKVLAAGQPVARLKVVHTDPGASKASTEDAGGLDPVVCIAGGARVMLCSNLWVEVGLVNGAIGTVVAVCSFLQLEGKKLGVAMHMIIVGVVMHMALWF